MIQKISAPVSVVFVFDHKRRVATPRQVIWEGRVFQVVKVGLHHHYKKGNTLYHVFSVSTHTLYFRLLFNTENLFWTLEEIHDGLPN